jgi:cation diffusion facilitator CzcD-associated flavoprotein CzcO
VSCVKSPDDDGLDLEWLKRKYAEERAKRLRDEGLAQFVELDSEFAHLAEDPWSRPGPREAVEEDVTVLVIGAGMGGLLLGSELHKKGIGDFRIVDKAGDFGGTWYWNRYPGCACDIESYVYLPLLEETGYIPSEKYAKATEIHHYCKLIAEHFELTDKALFHTGVETAHWDEEALRWIVTTDRGDRFRARFLVSCTGLFSSPKLPNIPGVLDLAGHSFHTSRWDYHYTGGGPGEPMEGLRDKTVGVIGTGATAIQVVPNVARTAKHLYVFQRTPSPVSYRGNRPTDPGWGGSLEAGWHQQRMENFTSLTSGYHVDEDLVDDAWTDIMKTITPPKDGSRSVSREELELAEMRKMDETRRRIDAIVGDPKTAEALKPYYHFGCKRPTFSDEYLQAFNQPNVTLVDTNGRGVERIGKSGPVANGTEYAVDCLIFATGFDFMTDYSRETGIDIRGTGGRSLSEHWSEGMRTRFGLQTSGFPNFLFISYAQAGITYNYNHLAKEQAGHIAHILAQGIEQGVASFDLTEQAEHEWVDDVVRQAEPRLAFLDGCTPGYANHEGKRGRSYQTNVPYMAGAYVYFDAMAQWRKAGGWPGMDVRMPDEAQA